MAGEGRVYPYRKCIGLDEAFEIFTRHTEYPLEQLRNPEGKPPFFVLLYGPPGCGKSYTFAHLSEILPEVNTQKAVSISLDALAESVGKFRTKSLNAYGRGALSECVGAYTSTIRSTYNNERFNKAPPKPKKGEPPVERFPSLIDLRIEALDKALGIGLNIIYERTVANAETDFLQEEVFAKTKAAGYDVYVVYPQVDSVEQLEERLAERPKKMVEQGFARVVEPEFARKFLETHDQYLMSHLLPKIDNGFVKGIYKVFPSKGTFEELGTGTTGSLAPMTTPCPPAANGNGAANGSATASTPTTGSANGSATATATGSANGSNASGLAGGKRKRNTRRLKKKRKTRRTRSH